MHKITWLKVVCTYRIQTLARLCLVLFSEFYILYVVTLLKSFNNITCTLEIWFSLPNYFLFVEGRAGCWELNPGSLELCLQTSLFYVESESCSVAQAGLELASHLL